MRRGVIVATVVLVAVARAFAQQTVFRAETDLVSFGVTVLARRGDLLTDLTGEHFEILEDGKPQTLKYFIRGDQADAAPELHLGLLLHTSGRTRDALAPARTAADKIP